MRTGLIILAAIAAILAACAGEEEEQGSAPDSIEEMSASDILDRVVEAASQLGSIQEERLSISVTHELPPLRGLPQGVIEGSLDMPRESRTRTLTVRVGEDIYTKIRPELPADFCDEQPEACEESPGLTDEELMYKGESYLRNPDTGKWVKRPGPGECMDAGSGSTCFGDVAYIEAESIIESSECPAAEEWFESGNGLIPDATEQRASTYYNFGFWLVEESERLDDEVLDGVSVARISGSLSFDFPDPYDPPEELLKIYEDCGIELPTPDPEFEWMREWLPDRNEGEFEIWVDDDFSVRRLVFESRSFNGDRLIQTEREEVAYSLFNEADLPGPLPD